MGVVTLSVHLPLTHTTEWLQTDPLNSAWRCHASTGERHVGRLSFPASIFVFAISFLVLTFTQYFLVLSLGINSLGSLILGHVQLQNTVI